MGILASEAGDSGLAEAGFCDAAPVPNTPECPMPTTDLDDDDARESTPFAAVDTL